MKRPAEARILARRLTRAYLTAFAIVLGIFALAVHVAFVLDLEGDQQGRLDGLLAQGRTAFEIRRGHVHVDVDDAPLAYPRLEALTWHDNTGRLIGHEGLTATEVRAARAKTSSVPLGTVTASIALAEDKRDLLRVDVGLAAGLLIALVAAAFGGRYLASQAIARIVSTMQTLRDFTADAAHELRGPLAALQSNADASIRAAGSLPAGHRTRLETIAATARSMSRTVDDLLLIARAGTPLERSLFAVNLDERVADAVAARRAEAGRRGVDLRAEPAAHTRVYGDPGEIDRILGNLIDNAVRFTPAGGSVVAGSRVERGGVCVRVTDTGIGIKAEDMPKVFERFWRGDPVRRQDAGTGLGLAIVRALVRRHGGEVSVQSSLATGSEFRVWLPARPPRPGLHDISMEP